MIDAAVPTAHVLDTNILVRLLKRDDPEHATIASALVQLIKTGADLCFVPQNVV